LRRSTVFIMRVDLFDFELAESAIALRPAKPKNGAKLLVVEADTSVFHNETIAQLPNLLKAGDALVVNNTRVIPTKLTGLRTSRPGAQPRIHANLHARDTSDSWRAFVRPARKLETGDIINFGKANSTCFAGELIAQVSAQGDRGEITLQFEISGSILDDAINVLGEMPLPPYISGKRPVDESDRQDYQTTFAKVDGAIAAPTAGLHFDQHLIQQLKDKGIALYSVTLHVGAGTFLPVRSDDTKDHVMHAEWGQIDEETCNALNEVKARGGRIVCVGTTSLRVLESAANDQGNIMPFSDTTDIFITPGYRFKTVDVLLTNFHLPRSTLFMLVSAFSGLECMQQAYAHAIAHNYRFYSYGDACLLFRADLEETDGK
jgi:S-adenosylmethionine:tRNA ribosyltransferase-isomerase